MDKEQEKLLKEIMDKEQEEQLNRIKEKGIVLDYNLGDTAYIVYADYKEGTSVYEERNGLYYVRYKIEKIKIFRISLDYYDDNDYIVKYNYCYSSLDLYKTLVDAKKSFNELKRKDKGITKQEYKKIINEIKRSKHTSIKDKIKTRIQLSNERKKREKTIKEIQKRQTERFEKIKDQKPCWTSEKIKDIYK